MVAAAYGISHRPGIGQFKTVQRIVEHRLRERGYALVLLEGDGKPQGGERPSLAVLATDLVRERMVIGEEIVEPPVGYLHEPQETDAGCLLYTSDAADDLLCVDLGGRRIIKKKKQ